MATLKKTKKICLADQLLLNAGQKYCRMLQGEHSAILSTFIKLPFVIKIFVLTIFEWPFYRGLTVVFTLAVIHKAKHVIDQQSDHNLQSFDGKCSVFSGEQVCNHSLLPHQNDPKFQNLFSSKTLVIRTWILRQQTE